MDDTPASGIREIRLTDAPHGHTLANRGCWAADGRSILFDRRDDETRFDSPTIDRVWVDTRRTETAYRAATGLHCGVPTCSSRDERFVFIRQDDPPVSDWPYCAWHRHGAIGRLGEPSAVETLDARDLVAPYTPGALRGGTHLHTFHPTAPLLLSTYEDHVLATADPGTAQANRRGLAVHLLGQPVTVPKTHPRNQDGSSFSVCVTELTDRPEPGSDQIAIAAGEAWLGGVAESGSGASLAIAFQGTVIDAEGQPRLELFLLTLSEDWSRLVEAGGRPLAGTPRTRPGVPAGVRQQRLTWTTDRKHPGLAGPRHWAVAAPDGSRIGFYLRDEAGIVQFWTVSPSGGEPVQVSRGTAEPSSPFSWHPSGEAVTYVADGSVVWLDVDSGRVRRLTPRASLAEGPTHHACVFAPDGSAIAYMRPVTFPTGARFNQLHLVTGWDKV